MGQNRPMTSAQVAAQLHGAVDEAVQLFQQVDDTRTTRRPDGGGWCAREVLGHLIDSACNNHRRFIIGQSPDTVTLDGYNQDEWVARQHYDRIPWRDLVALWVAYNRHLAHVMTCIPPAAAAHSVVGPGRETPVTLTFLMEDYVVHLRHHLDQIRVLVATTPAQPRP
jgi:DinB family protein